MRAGFSEALTRLRQRPGAWGAVPEETRAALARGEAVLEDLAPGAAHAATTVRFKQGQSAKKILDFPKGERPAPETYLEPDYIQEHLDKFREGASCLIFESAINEYNQIGRNDGLFVLPAREMDRLLEQARGDVRVIENALGIQKNLWRKNLSKGDRLLRIDFIPTKDSNLRIPDGNEIGADMLLWRPGGKTEGGLDEAVINPIRKNYKRTELNVK